MVDKSKVSWLTLIIVTLSIFTIVIDKTFMNVAIYALIRDLNTNIQTIQAIIAIYALTMASLMLLGGKLQKVIGRKEAFVYGAVIYGVGAIISALSINSAMLLLGWSILEGIGAALMMPASTSIITGTYMGENRAFALGITSSMASGAGTIGPIIGGFLTTFYTWRYAFALELLVVLAIIISSKKLISFPSTTRWSEIDVPGAVISSLGIFLLVMGILLLNNPSQWFICPFLVIGGIVLLISFYLYQKKLIKQNRNPLLDITLFKNRIFNLGNITRLIMNFLIGGILFVIPVFVQSVIGADPLTTGLTLIPMSVGIFILSFTAGRASRIQPRYIISLGFLAAIAGSIYLTMIISTHTTIIDMIPSIALFGIGLGIVFPHSANAVFSVARADQQPDASGILNTGINLGSSLGTAVLGVILILGTTAGMATSINHDSKFTYSQITTDLVSNLEKSADYNINTENGNKKVILSKFYLERVNAMKVALNVTTFLLIIGLICALFIPPPRKKVKNVKGEVNCPI